MAWNCSSFHRCSQLSKWKTCFPSSCLYSCLASSQAHYVNCQSDSRAIPPLFHLSFLEKKNQMLRRALISRINTLLPSPRPRCLPRSRADYEQAEHLLRYLRRSPCESSLENQTPLHKPAFLGGRTIADEMFLKYACLFVCLLASLSPPPHLSVCPPALTPVVCRGGGTEQRGARLPWPGRRAGTALSQPGLAPGGK